MEPKESHVFEDDKLKDAIRRAWKDDVAPPELIERVRSASASSPPQSAMSIGRRVRQFALAAAAVVLIGMAIVGYRTRGVVPISRVASARLPEPLAADLVERHHHQRSGRPSGLAGTGRIAGRGLGF
jgi:hypothetical protein